MKLVSKFVIVLISVITLNMLTGCSKVVSTEEFTANVIITDTYRRGSRYVGSVTSPTKYRIYFDYEGHKVVSSQRSVYKKLKNKVGETVEVILIKKSYDDNTVSYVFKELVE